MEILQKTKIILPQVHNRKVSFDSVAGPQEWQIFFYPEFESHIFEKESLEELQFYTSSKTCQRFQSFREQKVWQGTPLLMALFYAQKEIRFYSPRLGRELFLIEQLQIHTEAFADLMNSHDFQVFKNHVESVVQLSPDQFPSQYQMITLREQLPDFLVLENPDLEKETARLTAELRQHLGAYRPNWFEGLSDFGLNLTAQITTLRIHLLKFLAILPSLNHDFKGHEVKRILLESLRRLLSDDKRVKKLKKQNREEFLPQWLVWHVQMALWVAGLIPAMLLAWLVRFKVRFMAKRFIAGESIDKVKASFSKLFSSGRDVTLDQLGEWVVSEREADQYCRQVINLICGFNQYVSKGSQNAAGINRAHVSIKVSALGNDFRPYAEEETYKQVAPRLKKILLKAKEEQVFINIDAEQYDYRDLVFKIYRRVLLSVPELKDYQQTGIVVQAYLRDAYQHLQDIIALAKERELCLPIRLVKGAYWDAETIEAKAHTFDAPQFLNKEETDLHFRQLVVCIFENFPHLQLCLASHNYVDHCFAEALRKTKFPQLPMIEHQCLHMTYEALSVGLSKMNWPTRNYVPIGNLLVGMAYLVRRIMENSSQVGVLQLMRSHKNQSFLLPPEKVHRKKLKEGNLQRDSAQDNLTSEFFNITPLRLSISCQRMAAFNALKQFEKSEMGKKYFNSFVAKGTWKQVFCPSVPERLVGEIVESTLEDAERACMASEKAYLSGNWAKTHWLVRSSILFRAADLLLVKRKQLAALIVYEVGKSIPEAYADVDEAIDFLRFYACEEGKIHLGDDIMESCGPIATITPWNFPLAIPCGMVAAALVAGNTVILKSAEQSSLVGQTLVSIFHEAGVPRDVLIHLPGPGESVGNFLLHSPRIAGATFTGSKEVGRLIVKTCLSRLYHNKLFDKKFPARAIAEMGGKNAAIVTASAELDETVTGLLGSIFGHAGQKCSAASRVLVDNAVKERLVERLSEACQGLAVCEAFDPACAVNPVVTRKDSIRLKAQVEEAIEEALECGGKVIVDRSKENLPGYCVGPVLIELPFERALSHQSFAQRELFGPVAHIIGFDRPEQALKLFNSTEYALTGGIFSQSQDEIDYYTRFMSAGNIYVNRNITGARVAIEPFGGFKMSGTGPKAGSKDYLPSFHLNISCKRKQGQDGEEEGSHNPFRLSRPKYSSDRQRISALLKGVNFVLQSFESFFVDTDRKDKELLEEFEQWAHKNLLAFIFNRHANHKIPGQMSYNDFTHVGDCCLVVETFSSPSIPTFLRILSALGVGAGVTVASRGQNAQMWWDRLVTLFQQSGLGISHLSTYFVSETSLKKVLEQEKPSFVVVDGSVTYVNKVGKWLSELPVPSGTEIKDEKMIRLLSDDNLPSKNDFESFCKEFIWMRSFAVNTMRHGAPLELEV